MRNLRAIYNRAVEESYTEQKHPFKKVFVGNDKTIKRAIDEDVISRLKHWIYRQNHDWLFTRYVYVQLLCTRDGFY